LKLVIDTATLFHALLRRTSYENVLPKTEKIICT